MNIEMVAKVNLEIRFLIQLRYYPSTLVIQNQVTKWIFIIAVARNVCGRNVWKEMQFIVAAAGECSTLHAAQGNRNVSSILQRMSNEALCLDGECVSFKPRFLSIFKLPFPRVFLLMYHVIGCETLASFFVKVHEILVTQWNIRCN